MLEPSLRSARLLVSLMLLGVAPLAASPGPGSFSLLLGAVAERVPGDGWELSHLTLLPHLAPPGRMKPIGLLMNADGNAQGSPALIELASADGPQGALHPRVTWFDLRGDMKTPEEAKIPRLVSEVFLDPVFVPVTPAVAAMRVILEGEEILRIGRGATPPSIGDVRVGEGGPDGTPVTVSARPGEGASRVFVMIQVLDPEDGWELAGSGEVRDGREELLLQGAVPTGARLRVLATDGFQIEVREVTASTPDR